MDPLLLLLVVLAVGTELTLASRLPDHLVRTGLDGIAALAPALSYVGVAAARSWLALRRQRPLPAAAISAGIVAVTVVTLLLRSPGLAAVAVLAVGIGAGELFPPGRRGTLSYASDPSRTSARITAMVGLGTGITPLAVGFADGLAGAPSGSSCRWPPPPRCSPVAWSWNPTAARADREQAHDAARALRGEVHTGHHADVPAPVAQWTEHRSPRP